MTAKADLDATLGEEFLHIPVRETEPQVPADRQGDDLGREARSQRRPSLAPDGGDDDVEGGISCRESP
jgi:hypothetical protein